MGGGDLNLKKSWHPGTFRNQEKVWKEERKAADEEKKLQQLRKELEEERQIQELQRIQEQAGGKKRSDRLDWMYQAAPSAGARDEKDLEDYLLGKRRVDDILNKDSGMKALSKDSDSFMSQPSKANSIKDIQSKIREDPLLAIKRREQASMEALMKNPIKMRQLKEAKDPKKKKAKKSKEDKVDKEERRKAKSEHRSKRRSSRDRSDGSDNVPQGNINDGRLHRREIVLRTRFQDLRSLVIEMLPQLHHAHQITATRPGITIVTSDPGPVLLIVSVRHKTVAHVCDQGQGRHHLHTAVALDHDLQPNGIPPVRVVVIAPDPGLLKQGDDHIRDHPHPIALQDAHGRLLLIGIEPGEGGQALAEERARKLKAMTDDASAEEQARKTRLAEIAEMEAKQDAEDEVKRMNNSKGGQASFMKSAQKSAYNGMSMADRVQRGRATLQSS
ncbi:RNA-splicing factor [Mortierella alpina]|uniref:RNA-splicing factor n=1 Tax=Mortierella alpina TaxID=64518 RepID=A0A9P6LY49_MORAP|nr:RNA-splicing factor [Mortierella alpina]